MPLTAGLADQLKDKRRRPIGICDQIDPTPRARHRYVKEAPLFGKWKRAFTGHRQNELQHRIVFDLRWEPSAIILKVKHYGVVFFQPFCLMDGTKTVLPFHGETLPAVTIAPKHEN